MSDSEHTSPTGATMGDFIVALAGRDARDLHCVLPSLPQQLLGEADRAADASRDLAHAPSFAMLHPQRLALGRRQRSEDLARSDDGDDIRREGALGRLLVGEAALLPPVIHARVADRRVEPCLGVTDVSAFARVQTAEEDVVNQGLGFVGGDAVLFLRVRAQPHQQQLVPLFQHSLHCTMSRTNRLCSSIVCIVSRNSRPFTTWKTS